MELQLEEGSADEQDLEAWFRSEVAEAKLSLTISDTDLLGGTKNSLFF